MESKQSNNTRKTYTKTLHLVIIYNAQILFQFKLHFIENRKSGKLYQMSFEQQTYVGNHRSG